MRLHQMVRRHGNAPCRLGGIGVTARVASLTNYRRFDLYLLGRVAMERVCCDTTYPPNPCGVVILCCAGHVAHALHEIWMK